MQSDSSRLITLQLLGTSSVPPIPGVNQGHHDLSHHGKDPAKIAQLRVLEIAKLKTLHDFLVQLRATKEEGDSLLDRTMVFFSSNLGDASNHSVKNMPVLLAGGGFRHGQHLAFDEKSHPPLCNLYVSMLQRMGIAADKFGSGNATLTGLEMRLTGICTRSATAKVLAAPGVWRVGWNGPPSLAQDGTLGDYPRNSDQAP